MLKATTWSLLSGGVLAAGVAYVFAQRARARRVLGDLRHRPLLGDREVSQASTTLLSTSAQTARGAAEELDLEIELLDMDTLEEDEEEGYDASSPDDLGALWLSRATQTSGVRASPGPEGEAADEDELDPAGRPTEPPEQTVQIGSKDHR